VAGEVGKGEEMSIENRIKDAELLWKNNRKEGAFLNALIAIAATARKRYPYPKYKDNEAFIKFLQESWSRIKVAVEFRNECIAIEEIFYKWIRCQLVHEGELPFDIEFMDDNGDGMTFRAGGYPEYKLLIGYNCINYLINAVINAPENK
jgi:hypothetical protein